MGTTQSVVCPPSNRKLKDHEFELAMDSTAVEYHIIASVKNDRVSTMDLNGQWGSRHESPYEDNEIHMNGSHVRIKADTYLLYQDRFVRPKVMVCSFNGIPQIYIKFTFLKHKLAPGTHNFAKNTILLTPQGLKIINLKDDAVRPTLNQWIDQGLDPVLMAMAINK